MAKFPRNCDNCSRSFYDFAGEPPTASEIRGAKAAAVGGGPKKCIKGKSCSATCIAANEDCLVEFPEPIQVEIRKMAQYIVSQGNIEPGSEQDVEAGKAVQLVGGQLTREGTYQRGTGKYKKEVTERTFGTTERGQSRLIAPSEIRDLKANRDKLGDAEFNQQAMKALQTEVNARGAKLDDKSLGLVYDSLPLSARQALMMSGNPGKGKWYGVKDGQEVTDLSNGTRERGLAVLKMYIQQGGTDAYGSGRRVVSPADLDVEHVRPASKGGLDHPDNWILARSGAQRQRANEELGKWIDKLPDPDDKAAMNKYYSDFARDQQKKNAAKAAAAAVDPRQLPDADLVKVSPKNLRYMFDRDSFFQSGFYSSAGGGNRLTGAPPPAVSKAYGLVRKHNEDAAKEVRSKTKQILNKDWFENGQSTAQVTANLINLYRQKLPEEAFKTIEPQLLKWQAETLASYPSGPPRIIGSDSSSAPGAAPAPKGGGMSQKQAEAALDDLLKSL